MFAGTVHSQNQLSGGSNPLLASQGSVCILCLALPDAQAEAALITAESQLSSHLLSLEAEEQVQPEARCQTFLLALRRPELALAASWRPAELRRNCTRQYFQRADAISGAAVTSVHWMKRVIWHGCRLQPLTSSPADIIALRRIDLKKAELARLETHLAQVQILLVLQLGNAIAISCTVAASLTWHALYLPAACVP